MLLLKTGGFIKRYAFTLSNRWSTQVFSFDIKQVILHLQQNTMPGR